MLLGDEAFVTRLQPALEESRAIRDVPRAQRFADRPRLEALFGENQSRTKAERDSLIYEAHIHHGYSLSEIGKALDLHYTTISKVIKARTS